MMLSPDARNMIVAVVFIALVIALVWSIVHGRRLVRTERRDAVFGNPARAEGGWHWVVSGVSSLLILWCLFSWDTARAFLPHAANELCQVAKLDSAATPIRSAFPIDSRLLQGTEFLERDALQIRSLERRLSRTDLEPARRADMQALIDELRAILLLQVAPDNLDPGTARQVDEVAGQLRSLTERLADPGWPEAPGEQQRQDVADPPAWGETSTEIPMSPASERGRKFDAASDEMAEIAKAFSRIRNTSEQTISRIEKLEQRLNGFDDDTNVTIQSLTREMDKILRRLDDGNIFPPATLTGVEQALQALEAEKSAQMGSLRLIDALAMPGGTVVAGNTSCTEQGSGRWLPKPSDTIATFVRIADPDVGYKAAPLLWYTMKPVSEMAAFFIPDGVADLVPGEYPRHSADGTVEHNLKTRVLNIATGNYPSFSVPIPTGHLWDSVMRVLSGLFLGIVLGVPLGLFMGLSRLAKGFFDPLVELYRPVPPLAWAPLILTIFGIGDDGKIFLLFMVAFAIMVISARTGATGTQLSKIHAAHSLGATPRQILRKVILPNSLPEILTGVRIAIGVCWGTLVAAEMLAGTTGIGFVENVARKQSDFEVIWMTIIILGMLGLLFDVIMRVIIARTTPWRGKG